MPGHTRSIYSRRQRLGPTRFDNPLADFLDRLPDYFNDYQRNQLALERQQLADKRYEDSQERQVMIDDFNMARSTGDPNVMASVFRKYGKTSEANKLEKSSKVFSDFSGDYSDIVNMSTDEMYANLDKIKEVRDKAFSISSQYVSDNSGRGSYIRNASRDLKSMVDNIESTAGTLKPISAYSPVDKSMFDSMGKTKDKATERLADLETQYVQTLSRYDKDSKQAKQLEGPISLEKDKILRLEQSMLNIQSKYTYPELADKQISYSDKTDFAVDNDELILNNPDLSEKLQTWLEDPDNQDNFNIFKNAVEEQRSSQPKQDIEKEVPQPKDSREYFTSGLYGEDRNVPTGDKIIQRLFEGLGDVASGLPLPIPGTPVFGQDAVQDESPASSLKVAQPISTSNDQQVLDILQSFNN